MIFLSSILPSAIPYNHFPFCKTYCTLSTKELQEKNLLELFYYEETGTDVKS